MNLTTILIVWAVLFGCCLVVYPKFCGPPPPPSLTESEVYAPSVVVHVAPKGMIAHE